MTLNILGLIVILVLLVQVVYFVTRNNEAPKSEYFNVTTDSREFPHVLPNGPAILIGRPFPVSRLKEVIENNLKSGKVSKVAIIPSRTNADLHSQFIYVGHDDVRIEVYGSEKGVYNLIGSFPAGKLGELDQEISAFSIEFSQREHNFEDILESSERLLSSFFSDINVETVQLIVCADERDRDVHDR